MKFKYILFDLDGTITESGPGIMNSVAYALEKMGYEEKDREKLKRFIGPPLTDSMMKYYGMSEEDAAKAVRYYREYYTEKGIFENKIYDGVQEVLSDIKNSGRKIALATSKPELFAKQILDYFNLTEYFDFIGGATMDSSRNTKGDVINYTLQNLKIKDLSTVVMVGDREQDIIGAKQAGIDSIGVLFGYGDRKELENAGAVYIAKTVKEIINYI